MGNTAKSVHPIETDPVDWSPERLRDWIKECERLLAKIDGLPTDPEIESIRSLLMADLERKRGMLAERQTGR